MRARILTAASILLVTACSLVTGLSSYEIVDAADGAADARSSSSSSSGSVSSDALAPKPTDDAATTSGRDASVTVDAAGPRRVTDGLAALYTFKESGGAVAKDVSGIAPAIDLPIVLGAPTFLPDGGGLVISAPSFLKSSGAATKIIDACQTSNEVTVETWITPASATPAGITRTAGIAGASDDVDVVFNATGTQYNAVYRTAAGSFSRLDGPASSIKAARQHVVTTRRANGERRLYVDGVIVAEDVFTEPLSIWTKHSVIVANAPTMDRGWLGTVHLVAFYSRALTLSEVSQNFAVGP